MNQLGFPILSLITYLPLLGAFLVATLSGDDEKAAGKARCIAFIFSLIVLVLGVFVWTRFNPAIAGYQFVEVMPWLSGINVEYRMGVDGISLFLILLTLALTPIAILASNGIKTRARSFFAAMLLLESMTLGMFAATDFVLFYIFFEAVLLPMYLIIGVWGGERRIYAAVKFFVFTLAGSLFMLLAVVWIWRHLGTTDIAVMTHAAIPANAQMWLFLAFLAAFGVKAAVWPLHTWLPDAYGEAPVPGTIMLAAVLSKMGAYGFLRFALPMLPNASASFEPLMFVLGVVAVIYISYVALAQTDMKRMIAYSSVAHMGVIIIGLFTFTVEGIEGALFQMLSHGIVIAGPVHLRRHHHRARAVAQPEKSRRPGGQHAGLRGGADAVLPGEYGPARHLRLHRRDPGDRRCLEGEFLGLAAGRRGHGAGGGLYAGAAARRAVRQVHPPGLGEAEGPHRPRICHAAAAGGPGDVAGRLPLQLHPCV